METTFTRRPDQTFAFNLDRVFAPAADANEIYKTCGEFVVNGASSAGQNGVIFAYGHAGSGKTASIFGNAEDSFDSGLLLRSCRNIFASGAQQLTVSLVEVFKESFRDLLQQPNGKSNAQVLKLRDTITHTVVEGASEEVVSNMEELSALISACRGAIQSCKGHCIVTVSPNPKNIIFLSFFLCATHVRTKKRELTSDCRFDSQAVQRCISSNWRTVT